MKPTQEQISMRAYEIFEGSGNTGTPEENWLQAEQELQGNHQQVDHSSQHKLHNHQHQSKHIESSPGSRHVS